MTNPVGTKEGREELRRDLRRFCLEYEDPLATPLVPTPLFSALDGLDIAQEMAEHIATLIEKQLLAGVPCGCCKRLSRRWAKWKGEDSEGD